MLRVIIVGVRCRIEKIILKASEAGLEVVQAMRYDVVGSLRSLDGVQADLAIVVQEGGAIVRPFIQKTTGVRILEDFFADRGITTMTNGCDAMADLLDKWATPRSTSEADTMAALAQRSSEASERTHRMGAYD
ncbi:MAG TPA: hypothetical protein VI483_00505 [Candidatus Paceibacterota bacterium]